MHHTQKSYMDRIFNAKPATENAQSNFSYIGRKTPLIMEILDFIKKYKIPQKAIAGRLGMSYDMYRKKVSGTQITFSEDEIPLIEQAVEDYLNDLQKKFHEIVNKDAQ